MASNKQKQREEENSNLSFFLKLAGGAAALYGGYKLASAAYSSTPVDTAETNNSHQPRSERTVPKPPQSSYLHNNITRDNSVFLKMPNESKISIKKSSTHSEQSEESQPNRIPHPASTRNISVGKLNNISSGLNNSVKNTKHSCQSDISSKSSLRSTSCKSSMTPNEKARLRAKIVLSNLRRSQELFKPKFKTESR